MLLELGNYILDIDVERTRSFYNQARSITDACNCQGCRNYVKWALSVSDEPSISFQRMGVALDKPSEIYVNTRNKDGSLFYGGFYHLCGKILKGEDVWNEFDSNCRALDEARFVALTENFKIAFSRDIELLEKGFPTPAVQMEILANVDFVLSEKCDYEIL